MWKQELYAKDGMKHLNESRILEHMFKPLYKYYTVIMEVPEFTKIDYRNFGFETVKSTLAQQLYIRIELIYSSFTSKSDSQMYPHNQK